MSDWQPIPIGTKCYRPRSGTTSIERIINLYPEQSKPNAKEPITIYGLPGLSLWATAGDGPNRGLYVDTNGTIWIVSGINLYWTDSTAILNYVGEIKGAGRVRMVGNGTHVLIATSHELYYADKSDVYTHSLDMFNGVDYQDGYGLLTQARTQNLFITGLDDFTSIDALDFTTADVQPDNCLTCISNKREVFVGKEKTIEIFYNSGNAAFPFVRIPSGYIERGVVGPGAMTKMGGYVYWVGDDLTIYRAAGYTAEPISTPDISRLIKESYAPQSVEMFAFEYGGHHYIWVSFSDLTLMYDIDRGEWIERRSFGLDRWRASGYARINKTTHLVGDYSNGKIYQLDPDVYDEDGDTIERIIHFPPLAGDPRPVFIHELYLDVEAGVGLTSGQGSDPTVLLSYSDDDGSTWSSDIEASLGAIGVRRWRATFTRLGRSRNRTFRARISDPVKIAILGAWARFDVGIA